jgi:hypothetical protein
LNLRPSFLNCAGTIEEDQLENLGDTLTVAEVTLMIQASRAD